MANTERGAGRLGRFRGFVSILLPNVQYIADQKYSLITPKILGRFYRFFNMISRLWADFVIYKIPGL